MLDVHLKLFLLFAANSADTCSFHKALPASLAGWDLKMSEPFIGRSA
jgi:hypothetical protein